MKVCTEVGFTDVLHAVLGVLEELQLEFGSVESAELNSRAMHTNLSSSRSERHGEGEI